MTVWQIGSSKHDTLFILSADSYKYLTVQIQEHVILNLENYNINISSGHFHSHLPFSGYGSSQHQIFRIMWYVQKFANIEKYD